MKAMANLRSLAFASLFGGIYGFAAQAASSDASCKPVIDSDKARAAATSWHSKKTMNGMNMEMIRAGEDIYANMGGSGWKKMPPGMADKIAKAVDSFNVSECKKLGAENVDGVATTIYSFTTTVPGQPVFTGKVWVGNKDGLPYREAGEKYEGTTSYAGVVAPAVK